ncbi:MAG: CYTH domain-containing protein, partial [Gammaproteobacteria bacterium]|nr:CYTH domain-containing protein [Gammaproteobacteria bacterium]
MGIEIERKFLVKNDLWKNESDTGTDFKQGYLSRGGNCSVRVRTEGQQANINIKSATLGIHRQEFEYSIPQQEANELLKLFCSNTVCKKRYKVIYAGKMWEIDVFEQDNSGLIVAEIELTSIDEKFQIPPWAGDEVSA